MLDQYNSYYLTIMTQVKKSALLSESVSIFLLVSILGGFLYRTEITHLERNEEYIPLLLLVHPRCERNEECIPFPLLVHAVLGGRACASFTRIDFPVSHFLIELLII
jgi:hypothetical protein